MTARLQHIFVALAALALSQPSPSPAQPDGTEVVTFDVERHLREAKNHMGALRYEAAIALLEPVLEATRFDPDRLRETYLLLVEAHVYRGNLTSSGAKEQQLWYEAARGLIRECLTVVELRHTRPDPPERYPSEMLEFFDEVRRQMFGTFGIATVEPPDAEVIFAGDVLERREDGTWRQADVPVGVHVLVIRRPDYQEIAEDVIIAPATVTMRSYALQRRRGFGWYASRILVPVAAVTGIVVAGLVGSGESKGTALEGPPPPPVLP